MGVGWGCCERVICLTLDRIVSRSKLYTDTLALHGQTCSFLVYKIRGLLNTWFEEYVRWWLYFLALALH